MQDGISINLPNSKKIKMEKRIYTRSKMKPDRSGFQEILQKH